MKEKEDGRNFQADIHDSNYAAIYEKKKVTADTMIYEGLRETRSLNGLWSYEIDQYDTCLRAKWYEEKYFDENGLQLPVDFSFDEWPKVELPCCWNMIRPELFLYEGTVVFTRKFMYGQIGNDKVFLKVGAANYICRIFINKQFVGMHRGGSTPAYFDITEYLQKENRILITVDNTRRSTQVPMENTDWFNYGGIYRGMELIQVPKVFIKDMKISLEKKDTSHKTIRVELKSNEPINRQVQFKIPELSVDETIWLTDGKAVANFKVSPQLWTPEKPVLYDVEAVLGEDVLFRSCRF